MRGSVNRIVAMIQRHWYLYKGSWPRVLNMVGWPALNMVVFGFFNLHLAHMMGNVGYALGVLLGAVLLVDLMSRTQVGMMLTFMEEVWSRNLGQLFVTPLREWEYVVSLMVMAVIHGFIGFLPATLLGSWFFDFNLWGQGAALGAFMFLLIWFGWVTGYMICALILKHGPSAEWLAWLSMFLCMPFIAVYYPVSTLPDWVQMISWLLPPAYVFEGWRAVFQGEAMPWDLFFKGLGLNMLYLVLSVLVFYRALRGARRRGAILAMGE